MARKDGVETAADGKDRRAAVTAEDQPPGTSRSRPSATTSSDRKLHHQDGDTRRRRQRLELHAGQFQKATHHDQAEEQESVLDRLLNRGGFPGRVLEIALHPPGDNGCLVQSLSGKPRPLRGKQRQRAALARGLWTASPRRCGPAWLRLELGTGSVAWSAASRSNYQSTQQERRWRRRPGTPAHR